MVLHPEEASKMFLEVFELKWKTSEQADTVLEQYRKFA